MIRVKNLTDRAEIYLYGVIIDDTDANWLLDDDKNVIGYQFPADIREQLESVKGLPIDLHVASDGGDVAAGLAIYNMLASHEAPVTAYIDSWAASIASLIVMSADKIVMPANTFIMIHNPAGGGFGGSDYLRSIADWLDKIRNMIADTYAKNSNKTAEEFKALMDAESWLTAADCKELWGDKVEVTGSNNIEAVAQYKTAYKTAPAALVEEHKPELEKPTEAKINPSTTVSNTEAQADKNKIIKVLQEAYGYEEKGRDAASN